jgi:hypothetical protein
LERYEGERRKEEGTTWKFMREGRERLAGGKDVGGGI